MSPNVEGIIVKKDDPGVDPNASGDLESEESGTIDSTDVLKTGGALAWGLGADDPDRSTFPENAWPPGHRIGRLTIDSLLGTGGMGEVYRGKDEKLGRSVAVKRLRPDWRRISGGSRERMLREAQILSQLQHPGICQIYDLIESDDADVIVMELVRGETLSAARPHFSQQQMLVVAEKIADAVAAAHRHGVIHRDLKPDNVMVTPEGEVKVLDFGVAFSLSERAPVMSEGGAPAEMEAPDGQTGIVWGGRLTSRGMVIGTPRYMSPEQLAGRDLTTASDIYAMGIVLQELFTGKSAYSDVDMSSLLGYVSRAESVSPTGLDADLARLLGQMKHAEPEARPTAEQVVARLRKLRGRPARRRFFAAAAVASAALVVATALVSMRLGRETPLIAAGHRGRVVLLPFENQTGETQLAWISGGLRDMVAQTLDGVEGIQVVPPENVDRLVTAADGTRTVRDDQALQRLVSDLGAEVLVSTVVRKEEGLYVLDSGIITSRGKAGKRIIRQQEITKAASELADRLVRRLVPAVAYSGLEDRFSDDPTANRLYAMGLDTYRREGAEPASELLRSALRVDPQLHWARVMLGELAERLSSWDEAKRYLEEAQAHARKTGDRQMAAACLSRLARLSIHRNEFEEAERLAREALQMARENVDRERQTEALTQLGDVARKREKWKDAEGYYTQALGIRRELGDQIGVARAMHNVGVAMSLQSGREGEAVRALEESLDLKRKLGMSAFEAMTLNSLAVIAVDSGEHDRAEQLYQQVLASYRKQKDLSAISQTLGNLGVLEQNRGHTRSAVAYLEESCKLATEIGDQDSLTLSAFNLAYLLGQLGKLSEAEHYLEIADTRYSLAWETVAIKARLAWLRGDVKGARALVAQAKSMAGEQWSPDLDNEIVGPNLPLI